jgi:glutathione S-transferase
MPGEITLCGDGRYWSPWVLSVWIALKEKGIAFRYEPLDYKTTDILKGQYTKDTLNGKVPSLRADGHVLSESLAILEWLEETYPAKPLYPRDGWARARDRMILSYIRSDFAELRRCMPFEGLYGGSSGEALTPEGRAQVERLLDLVETRGRGDPTLADFDLALMMRRPIHYRYDLSGHPGAVAFSDAIWNRPSVRSFWQQAKRAG